MTSSRRRRGRPERTCVVCRRVRDKAELLRIVRTPEGVHFDPGQRIPGRGAYLCADRTCVDAAGRRGGHPLQRALRGAAAHQVRSTLDQLRTHLRSPQTQERHTDLPSGGAGATTASNATSVEEKTDALRGEQEHNA